MITSFRKRVSAVVHWGMFWLAGCRGKEEQQKEHTKAPEVTGNVYISILDVGKADCIVLQTDNYTMMIDTAEKNNADDIEKFLADNHITKIDYLELTHYDKDHIGGLKKLLKHGLKIEHVYGVNHEETSDTYINMMEALEEYGLSLEYVEDRVELLLDDLLVEVYPPGFYLLENTSPNKCSNNESSLVTKVTHGENRFLFAGDACKGRLKELSGQMNVDVNFLKVPHHGKRDANTTAFAKKVRAEYAVITCSHKNMPDRAVVRALKWTGAKVYETRNGQVDCSSDGRTIMVTQI